ncbi:hypothetical protein [Parasitella parasitica]|uniref:Uncharacterized protein n=1 Tax=Parasitella parasitica TaxID=35722 RepID=A0A0B7NQT9_9FUNG|nr:hypothetical protein [Parasitella parasitica]
MAETRNNCSQLYDEGDSSKQPSAFGNMFDGWSGLLTNNAGGKQAEQQPGETSNYQLQQDLQGYGADRSAISTATSSSRSSMLFDDKRKNSVQLGRRVMSEILENDNVANAIQILQQALDHLQMTDAEGKDEEEQVSKIYSQIIKSLCDPNVARIVDEMSKKNDKVPDIQESVLWRLFTKVVESGFVLQRDAHLAVISTLVDKDNKSLALKAMYTLPRREWDTLCYQTAILLHLLQDPKQSQEAQGLLTDYGKPYLEIASPVAPNRLPPVRTEMPLMNEVTEQDQFKLWMFYQSALSGSDEEWHKKKLAYEKLRRENMAAIKSQEEEQGVKDWALTQLQIETKKQRVDRISTDNDNTMIFVAMNSGQFEYGWQVYQAMGDAVNGATPCIAMHLCWAAFCQIPAANISRRTYWENRAWEVYSRFMCSEYLHPDENEAPGFLHDILLIAANSPESMIDKKARYTKSMSVYNLLVRLHFEKLLCDDRVLGPILCTLLYECKGSPTHIVTMCSKAFEIWNRKLEIRHGSISTTSYSVLWGLLVFCLKSGDKASMNKILRQLLEKDINEVPSSIIAIVQTIHDQHICDGCYFFNYMFQQIEFTDSDGGTRPISMDKFGFVYDNELKTSVDCQQTWRSNINELQAASVSMAVKTGVANKEELVPKQMYYSTKKAKALVRHCLKQTDKSLKQANT